MKADLSRPSNVSAKEGARCDDPHIGADAPQHAVEGGPLEVIAMNFLDTLRSGRVVWDALTNENSVEQRKALMSEIRSVLLEFTPCYLHCAAE